VTLSVDRIELPNPVFDMEGENNAYLLASGDDLALVDTAVDTPETRELLATELSERGYALSDIDRVLLTHWHPDHAGLAAAVQAESGATVHAHEADAPLVRGDPDAFERLNRSRRAAAAEWQVPPEGEAELRKHRERAEDDDGGYGTGDQPAVEPLADGDRVPVGDIETEAVHAPGHTAGETCFVPVRDGDRGRRVFTGDALLPDYTPNVGGADTRLGRPLTSHLETLGWLASGAADRALPGHGDPIEDPAARASDILSHHRDRAETLLAVLEADAPATVWTASQGLFGELGEVHLMLGLGETHAHLEHLRRAGLVERTDEGYVPADDAGERVGEAFPHPSACASEEVFD